MRRKQSWSDDDLQPMIEYLLANCHLHIPSPHWHLHALKLRTDHTLSYWDSLIVAAALEAGCHTLISEDMQHSQLIENQLRIINPFTSA